MRSILNRVINFVGTVCWIAIGLYCGYWLMQITTCCSFHAPTGSMRPTIIPGDYGIVNKWKMGARIFDIPAAINEEKVKVYRLPGYGSVERNDVIVFNYPFIGKDTLGMNMRKYIASALSVLRATPSRFATAATACAAPGKRSWATFRGRSSWPAALTTARIRVTSSAMKRGRLTPL